MTRMHAGFTGVVQHEWPRPRGWAPPQRLDALDVTTLPGVGATLAKRLRTFGIQSVRDLLFHAPRRYESAVDQVPIAKLGLAEGEVAIEGRIVSARARPLRGRRTLVTAIVRDDSGDRSAPRSSTSRGSPRSWLRGRACDCAASSAATAST